MTSEGRRRAAALAVAAVAAANAPVPAIAATLAATATPRRNCLRVRCGVLPMLVSLPSGRLAAGAFHIVVGGGNAGSTTR